MTDLSIITKTVSDFGQNARVLINNSEKKICFVDPGADLERILDGVDLETNTVESIFLTHCHIDHAGAVKPLLKLLADKGKPTPTLYYHSKEWIVGKNIENYAKQCGFSDGEYFNPPNADINLDDMETFKIGNITARLLFTPGHAPGHVAMYFENVSATLTGNFAQDTLPNILISGDSLFRESVGRTDLPLSNPQDLVNSIQEKLYTLPDNTLVLPGHGRNTTIEHEKQHNPFIRPL
jgi:hydroxyacylglutathione hydrolase